MSVVLLSQPGGLAFAIVNKLLGKVGKNLRETVCTDVNSEKSVAARIVKARGTQRIPNPKSSRLMPKKRG